MNTASDNSEYSDNSDSSVEPSRPNHSELALAEMARVLRHGGRLLVLEDVGEAPYRIDRLLTHWRTSGVLEGVVGLGLGRFSWKEDDVLPGDLSMEEVLQERLGNLGIPLVGRLPVAAPEIIEHDGQTYIASLLPSLKGIRIARLEWGSTKEAR
jgi:SAM-dependent methyltransferase